MTDTAAHDRAVQLLRGHLSPEQLAAFDTIHPVGTSAYAPPDVHHLFRWFNSRGSLGGQYTISGLLAEPFSQAIVGFGYNRPGPDWCVHAYSYQNNEVRLPAGRDIWTRTLFRDPYGYMPVADQMLALKLAIETEEETFLLRAVPVSTRPEGWNIANREAIEKAAARVAV